MRDRAGHEDRESALSSLPMKFLRFAVAIAILVAPLTAQKRLRAPDVKYVPSPQSVVDAMLELAHVTAADIVYDLGSGDGRIPIRAAQRYGARAVGVELEPRLVAEASDNAKRAGVAGPRLVRESGSVRNRFQRRDRRHALPDAAAESTAESEAEGASSRRARRLPPVGHGTRLAAGADAGRQRTDDLPVDDPVALS